MKLRDRIELVVIAATAVGSVAVSLLDLFGLLGPFSSEIPSITLLLVGVIAAFLALERRTKWEGLEQKIAAGFSKLDAQMTDWDQNLQGVDAFLSSTTSADRFASLRLAYGVRGFRDVARGNEIRLGREYVFQLWSDALQMANSFLAFNYVSSEEVWGTGWSFNVAQALQAAKIAEGATIKRVFVVDSESEAMRLAPLMESQQSIGVAVRWALKSTVEKNPVVRSYLEKIGTWDIVVVDDDLLFRVFLDSNRQMSECALTRDTSLAGFARHVFSDTFQTSTKI